jgi:LPXTG-site transpeptidase (sortase) family protein
MNTIQPDDKTDNPAANLIRSKLNKLYSQEPDAVEEAIETIVEPATERSKHQKFMYDLTTSGKSMPEIQTAWHNYYTDLSDIEKHEVWQEFYSAKDDAQQDYERASTTTTPTAGQYKTPTLEPISPNNTKDSIQQLKKTIVKKPHLSLRPVPVTTSTVSELKTRLLHTTEQRARKKLTMRQHLQSLGFGLAVGAFMVLILLFGFFNERFIAPFITPSRTVGATPLIISDDAPVGPEAKIIIPKINVDAPVVYDVPTIEEHSIQEGLERGVVHYITTANPGEQGNAVIFGHSSNNILNKGNYKFVFVLLKNLDEGDVFYIQKDSKRYAYKVFEKKIVSPDNISVLNPVPGKTATMTLITCDPPGTAINRLVIVAEQISPDPNGNTGSTAIQTDAQPEVLPSNSPSLWSRFTGWLF